MACSRNFPMNDTRNGQREPAVGRKTENAPNDRPDTRRRRSRLLFGGGAFLLLAVGLAFGTSRSYSRQREVMATADHAREFGPSGRVVTVGASPGNIVVTLPATTAAFADANIYARATGYIGKRNVDIGDHVKQGELLAEHGVPELVDQIFQNEATLKQLNSALEQAQAALKLDQVTWDR